MRVVFGLRARRRGLTSVAALSAGSLLVASCAIATATSAARKAGTTTAVRGTKLWVRRYNGAGNGTDKATSVAISPDGHRVYVTGRSAGPSLTSDYTTIAYNAVTGARLWVSRYNGSANGYDYATTVVVSPDGRTVYVTGSIYRGLASGRDYATVAYSAATGARLWVSIYPNQAPYGYGPIGMVVSPDGRTVYVTGHAVSGVSSDGVKTYGFGTIAYNAATGARLWVSIYAPAHGSAIPEAIGISPDGTRIFVTGMSDPAERDTVAYDAATGGQLWASSSHAGFGLMTSLAVSPGGGMVFVSGSGDGQLRLDTIGYDAATGARRWESLGPPGQARSLVVSPDGTKVFATGWAREAASTYLTVAYDAATGTSQPDCATVAYAAGTGAQLWVQRYNGRANGADICRAIAVSRTGRTVFVTGFITGATSGFDYLTIAYRA